MRFTAEGLAAADERHLRAWLRSVPTATMGIGAPPEVEIPDLAKQLPRAANLGRPAVNDCPQLRRALGYLTQEIAAVRSSERPRSLFARLFGRGG